MIAQDQSIADRSPTGITGVPEETPSRRRKRWLVTLPALVLPLLGCLVYFDWFSDHPAAKTVYGATKFFTLVWPAIAVFLILRPAPVREGSSTPPSSRHWRALPLGAAVGLGVTGLMAVLWHTPVGDFVRQHGSNISGKAANLGFAEHFILMATAISLVHSLLEEYYWRWFVFGQLRRLVNRPLAHGLAGAAFAAHHVVIATQFFPGAAGWIFGLLVGIGGIFFSLLYERQQTLTGAWLAHLIVDVGLMVIGHLLIFPQGAA